jgi:hypothetical protein
MNNFRNILENEMFKSIYFAILGSVGSLIAIYGLVFMITDWIVKNPEKIKDFVRFSATVVCILAIIFGSSISLIMLYDYIALKYYQFRNNLEKYYLLDDRLNSLNDKLVDVAQKINSIDKESKINATKISCEGESKVNAQINHDAIECLKSKIEELHNVNKLNEQIFNEKISGLITNQTESIKHLQSLYEELSQKVKLNTKHIVWTSDEIQALEADQ